MWFAKAAGTRGEAMEYFTTRNSVILALVQIGVIVTGVLGAGVTHQFYAQTSIRPPDSAYYMVVYGWLTLAVPIAWVTATLWIQRSEASEPSKAAIFWSGVLFLLLLLLGVWYGAAKPFLRLAGGGCPVF